MPDITAEVVHLAIVDDDPIVRRELPHYFSDVPGVEVALVADGFRALSRAYRSSPLDVVLTDVRMPEVDGISLTRWARTMDGGPVIVGMTAYDVDEYTIEMLRAGARGIVLKAAPREELVRAVLEALSGGAFVSPVLAGRLGRYLQPVTPDRQTDASLSHCQGPALSPREKEILGLILDGMSNGDIAEELYVSLPTVKKHVASLLRKYGVDTRLQLAVEVLNG